jgi:membrane protease YdiL (CAAX protease family)
MPGQSSTTNNRGDETRASKLRAVIALSLLLPFPSLGTAASMFWWPGTMVGKGLFVFCKVWIVLLPLLWLLRVERGRVSWSPPKLGGFGPAILLGVVIAAAILVTWAIAGRLGWIDPGYVAERARQTGLADRSLYLAGALYWITLNSLMEEYVWRWFCFRQCETLFGGVGGVLASAAGFTLHHIVALAGQFSWPVTLMGSLGVFCGGAVWSWLYLRYRSVWPCYVSHAIADVPIFALGYWMIFGSA